MLDEKSAAKGLTALAEYREKVKSGEIIPTKSLITISDRINNWCNMTKPFYTLQEVNPHRYRVLADTGIREHVLCEIAQYEPINTWYLVQKSLNHELSEQALKFIYESVKRLNMEVVSG